MRTKLNCVLLRTLLTLRTVRLVLHSRLTCGSGDRSLMVVVGHGAPSMLIQICCIRRAFASRRRPCAAQPQSTLKRAILRNDTFVKLIKSGLDRNGGGGRGARVLHGVGPHMATHRRRVYIHPPIHQSTDNKNVHMFEMLMKNEAQTTLR